MKETKEKNKNKLNNKSLKKNTNKFNIRPFLSKHKWGISFYLFMNVFIFPITTVLFVMFSANAVEQISLALKMEESIYFMNAIKNFLMALGIYYLGNTIYFTDLLWDKIGLNITQELNLAVSKHSFQLNSETYSNYGTGIFSQRIIDAPTKLVFNYKMTMRYLSDFINQIAVVGYTLFLNLYIGFALIGVVVIAYIIERYRVKSYKFHYKEINKLDDKVYSLTNEVVRSEKDIKAIGLEKPLTDTIIFTHDKVRDARIKLNTRQQQISGVRNLCVEVGVIGIMILGIILMEKSLIALSTFMVVYNNRFNLYSMLSLATRINSCVVEAKIQYTRISSVFDENNFVTEKFGNTHIDNMVGEIEFKNVSYIFNEYEIIEPNKDEQKKLKNIDTAVQRKKIAENQIFKDLNFKITPNTTVAFVGKSGSGKSTILDLVSKMKVATSGKVLIDGVNINDLNKQTLRDNISLINQFPYIFDMSIKDNMLLTNKNASDEDIINALKKASFYDFVKELPNGVNTKVGENGVKLSGGQKQRLAIARAFLKPAKILIFDESTSSLDNFAQENIKKSIDELKGKSTIIIVAHRLSTIKNVDKIFFLENGKIIDEGTFEELFNKNEVFKNLFEMENLDN